jgi:ubiquitin carboxyl-terminal hydrolase 8
LPGHLIIHLKRFKYQGVWRDKINTYVDFPVENLELGSFAPSDGARDRHNYKLFGICNHTGTMDGGHYTAFGRHLDNNRWYKYDDQDVREIQDTSTLKSSSSYILFYSVL